MKPIEKMMITIGLILLVAGLYLCIVNYPTSTESPVATVSPVFTATSPAITESVLSTVVQTETSVIVPTQVPVSPLVNYYILDKKIDLSSGRSTAMMIQLPQGGNVLSTWAGAIAYQSGDDDMAISPFDPKAGTIYTILGDTAVVVAHSGRRKNNWDLFASSLDRYLRVVDLSNPKQNESVGLVEGVERLKGMIGSTVYFCQANEKMEAFTLFERCPGDVVKMKIVGGIMIGPELMEEYGQNILVLRSWLAGKYPEAGFDQIAKNTGLIFVTCVQKYTDQPVLSGVHNYEYNRVFLAFEVVP